MHITHFGPIRIILVPSLMAIRHVWQPLDNVFALCNANNRHTRNLPYAPLEIPIVCRDQVESVFLDPVHNTIIGVSALVFALEALPSLVASDPERNTVFWAEFLELSHNAGRDNWSGLGVEKIHEGLVEFELGVHRVREEVGVHEDGVGRAEGSVGLEEEGRGDLWAVKCQSCLLFTRIEIRDTYISRFALFSSSFFFASISPAI